MARATTLSTAAGSFGIGRATVCHRKYIYVIIQIDFTYPCTLEQTPEYLSECSDKSPIHEYSTV